MRRSLRKKIRRKLESLRPPARLLLGFAFGFLFIAIAVFWLHYSFPWQPGLATAGGVISDISVRNGVKGPFKSVEFQIEGNERRFIMGVLFRSIATDMRDAGQVEISFVPDFPETLERRELRGLEMVSISADHYRVVNITLDGRASALFLVPNIAMSILILPFLLSGLFVLHACTRELIDSVRRWSRRIERHRQELLAPNTGSPEAQFRSRHTPPLPAEKR